MPTSLTQQEMKHFVLEHFEDFVNRNKTEVIHHNMTPDFLDHDGPGSKPADRATNEAMMRTMQLRMPGIRVEVLDILADIDRVCCRNIWRWTDAATGAHMQFHGFVMWRFEGNQIAERWATVTSPAEGSSWSIAETQLT